MASSTFREAIEEICKLFAIKSLKEEQEMMIKTLLDKRDCIAVLPTGYGKSLPYQLLLPLARKLGIEADFKIVVCCPLVALMEDQVKRLEKVECLRNMYKGRSKELDKRILDGDFDILFASPEALVGDQHIRLQLQKYKIGVIVVDEFHTIYEWGGEATADDSGAFRKWFRYIGELRSLWPKANLLALSATRTNNIKRRVYRVLGLDPAHTTELTVSPNKPNIKLIVKKVDKNIETSMCWLIDALDDLEDQFPRTLVYCNSISDVSKLYCYVVSENNQLQKLVDMFHSETLDENKSQIIKVLGEEKSNVRIIFATTALGMGIDVVNCTSMIIFGPPRSVVDLVQMIGRVGRCGSQSVAIIMFNSYQLGHCEKEVKEFLECKSCRRKKLLESFLCESEMSKVEVGTHICCDICADLCTCKKCKFLDLEHLLNNSSKASALSQCSDSDFIDYYSDHADGEFTDNEELTLFQSVNEPD
ncbi:ATP-dependent DNA helicase RecQ-like [Saccostrea cucullata]|uniref:ATP-dependent DNA helicase RecQ-like n=1 Tax=Saccostrea cuccullata TaxID=36930 RepID=UPI002ED639D5